MTRILLILLSIGISACHTPAAETGARVLVTTPSPDGADTESDSSGNAPSTATAEQQAALEALVARDAALAAEILNKAMAGAEKDIAALTAIYAMRLGVKHEPLIADRALLQGIHSADGLIACLSYRWLITRPEIALPRPRTARMDPVTLIFAALAHGVRGRVPSAFSAALALDDGTEGTTAGVEAFEKSMKRIQLISMAVDDGPLSLAIGFHEARRMGLKEVVGNSAPVPLAARYRTELYHALSIEKFPPETEGDKPFEITRMSDAISPSLQVPIESVRKLCAESTGSLQREALRLLAVSALSPVSGDLAAARAGMDSADLRNRVEAARTYLLLSARATVK